MNNSYEANEVINGTFGEIWIDSDYLAEVTAFKAEVTVKYEDVKMVRRLINGKKMVGLETAGEVTYNKVSTRGAKKVSDKLKAGKAPIVRIISKIDDPDSIGAERVLIKDASLENLVLADWENGVNGEVTNSFSFGDWDYLDIIE